MTLRFDEALRATIKCLTAPATSISTADTRILLIRDIRGQLRVLVDSDARLEGSATEEPLQIAMGAFKAPGSTLLNLPRAEGFDSLFASPDAYRPVEHLENFKVLDRSITAREWYYPQTGNANPLVPRCVFYGFKGGVGRSTALAMTAWNLSRQGKRVLVVDLDLESPGIGSMLLPSEAGLFEDGDTSVPGWPSFGLVDWFVEDAVGQADDELVRSIVQPSRLAQVGEILVVPAAGGLFQQDYVSKLARVYADLPNQQGLIEVFGDRLLRALAHIEAVARPDVVLLDSRAGIHNVSAAALTRLGAFVYVFAQNTAQTWAGLGHLFQHWSANPNVARRVRASLRTLASMVPSGIAEEEYLRSFCDGSYTAYAELYDDESAYSATRDPNVELFSFGVGDEDAPHFPALVRYDGEYVGFSPLTKPSQVDSAKAEYVFGGLFKTIDRDILQSRGGASHEAV